MQSIVSREPNKTGQIKSRSLKAPEFHKGHNKRPTTEHQRHQLRHHIAQKSHEEKFENRGPPMPKNPLGKARESRASHAEKTRIY